MAEVAEAISGKVEKPPHYQLSSSDRPGDHLVTPHPLKGTYYLTWRRAVTNALISKHKIVYMDGRLPKPPQGDPHKEDWITCNSIVISWIVNCLNEELYHSIVYHDTTSEKENEEERLYQFVMALNDSYGVISSNILCKDLLSSLSNAYSLLTSKEMTLGRPLIELVAFNVNNDGHRGKGQNKKSWCEHCKKPNHTKKNCFELVGYPANWQRKKKEKSVAHAAIAEIKENDMAQAQSHQQHVYPTSLSQEQFDQLLSLLVREKQATPTVNFIGNLARAKEKSVQWILDSGVLDHIVSDATLLVEDTKLEKSIKDITTKRVIGTGKLKEDLYYFESEMKLR
ncbi:UNVERIFIED_CONTAM: hypothetical protein Slati_1690600 [Sesamum latifolium]|uniref:Retrotransposon Copia-like N-terminal domain-containing protein n=1 Tax=Sesamum latifolium TaxID=2727402 RepID=A0AAW2WV22_9LAMI